MRQVGECVDKLKETRMNVEKLMEVRDKEGEREGDGKRGRWGASECMRVRK